MYAHVNNGKLVPRTVKCMFLGYASESKGYRMWCPESKKVIQNRDTRDTFNETAILSSGKDSVAFSIGAGRYYYGDRSGDRCSSRWSS